MERLNELQLQRSRTEVTEFLSMYLEWCNLDIATGLVLQDFIPAEKTIQLLNKVLFCGQHLITPPPSRLFFCKKCYVCVTSLLI